ncbi:MAG: type IV pilus secretin PilQ [Desulfobacula sp.]|nr:type IV pilus secretin PilQ [Desulfobacula sp.]
MVYFQKKRIQNIMKMVCCVLLAVFIITGCAIQKTENVQPVDKKQAITKVQSDISSDQTVQPIERIIHALTFEQNEQKIKINIEGNQKLVYTSIRQDFPFGIAIYLPETKINDSFKKELINTPGIKDVTVEYADKEKITAKVEILLTQDFNYEVVEDNNRITVSLFGDAQITKSPVSEDFKSLSADKAIDSLPGKDSTGQTVIIPGKTATMTYVEFNTLEDGKSDIVIHTNQPVKYDIEQQGYDTINLNLYNTIIPDYHKRPLLTEYFKSAVERLTPRQIPGKAKNSKIEIKIRQQVPYRVVQKQNTISLFFDPSTVEPPVFDKARKIVSSGTTIKERVSVLQLVPEPVEKVSAEKKSQKNQEDIFGSPKLYTGEKIKLDFYETDIKNVFRILRSVGGLNFAIDKGVEGKVTMTLEDPVPWDQVLDLVLKMNNLGQKQEGNVIRIATLAKLKQEEALLQDTIAARKKSREQKKSLEPLVTEYISINYSDANADIKPHIDQILTKGRGTISVDARTNMIILTDIQEKIDQAREIIYRLDKVTPQIMIEAKVVEVTKDFSRELGLGLSFTKTQTANSGRSRDFSVGLNYPVGSPTNLGDFNFYRILGSDFLNLNAQLAASESKGDIKVVSSPRILTLDNKKAIIKQGLEYAYLERDDSGGSSVKFKSIDLSLEVTPHVTPDKRIAMTIFLTKNDIDTITNGVPSLSTNEAQTELLVNNNDTVVIGGIVKTTDNKSSSGTPLLSDIPYLGRLFRTDVKSDKRNELLIFLTPSIVQLEQRRN